MSLREEMEELERMLADMKQHLEEREDRNEDPDTEEDGDEEEPEPGYWFHKEDSWGDSGQEELKIHSYEKFEKDQVDEEKEDYAEDPQDYYEQDPEDYYGNVYRVGDDEDDSREPYAEGEPNEDPPEGEWPDSDGEDDYYTEDEDDSYAEEEDWSEEEEREEEYSDESDDGESDDDYY